MEQRRDELEVRIANAKDFPEICKYQGALIEILKLAAMPETDAMLKVAEVTAKIENKREVLSRTERRKAAIPGSR